MGTFGQVLDSCSALLKYILVTSGADLQAGEACHVHGRRLPRNAKQLAVHKLLALQRRRQQPADSPPHLHQWCAMTLVSLLVSFVVSLKRVSIVSALAEGRNC